MLLERRKQIMSFPWKRFSAKTAWKNERTPYPLPYFTTIATCQPKKKTFDFMLTLCCTQARWRVWRVARLDRKARTISLMCRNRQNPPTLEAWPCIPYPVKLFSHRGNPCHATKVQHLTPPRDALRNASILPTICNCFCQTWPADTQKTRGNKSFVLNSQNDQEICKCNMLHGNIQRELCSIVKMYTCCRKNESSSVEITPRQNSQLKFLYKTTRVQTHTFTRRSPYTNDWRASAAELPCLAWNWFRNEDLKHLQRNLLCIIAVFLPNKATSSRPQNSHYMQPVWCLNIVSRLSSCARRSNLGTETYFARVLCSMLTRYAETALMKSTSATRSPLSARAWFQIEKKIQLDKSSQLSIWSYIHTYPRCYFLISRGWYNRCSYAYEVKEQPKEQAY